MKTEIESETIVQGETIEILGQSFLVESIQTDDKGKPTGWLRVKDSQGFVFDFKSKPYSTFDEVYRASPFQIDWWMHLAKKEDERLQAEVDIQNKKIALLKELAKELFENGSDEELRVLKYIDSKVKTRRMKYSSVYMLKDIIWDTNNKKREDELRAMNSQIDEDRKREHEERVRLLERYAAAAAIHIGLPIDASVDEIINGIELHDKYIGLVDTLKASKRNGDDEATIEDALEHFDVETEDDQIIANAIALALEELEKDRSESPQWDYEGILEYASPLLLEMY